VRSTQTAPGTVPSKKKQRSFLVGLLALLGIRYDPQKGSWGCAFLPATISVALVIVVVGGIIVGPVLKLIPPFSPGLTVIGTVAPGASVIVHGTNFPPGSRINLTLDGVSIAFAPTAHRSISHGLDDLSLATVQMSFPGQTEQLSSSGGSIMVRSDGTFDAQVSIPKSWQPNSQHTIEAQAIGQDGRAQAQVQQTVTMPGPNTAQGGGTTPLSSSTPSPTPTATTSVNFAFSGSLSGQLAVNTVNSCGVSKGTYTVDVIGGLNGTTYQVTLTIQNYTGPNQYSSAGLGAGSFVGVKNPNDNGDRWSSLGQQGSITVNSGEKSGSISMSVTNPVSNGQAQITGNWTC